MRAQLVLLVVCMAGTAMAGYPSRSRGSPDRELAALLDKYLRAEVRPPNPPVVNANPNDDSSGYDDDEEFDCSSVQPPCEFDTSDDGTAFYECAFRKLKETENAIARLVKDNFNEDLFREEEMDIVWDLRSDWKLSMEMKEVVEVIFMELAETRFSKYNWEDVDDESANSVQTKVCEYIWLREQTFEKGEFFHEH